MDKVMKIMKKTVSYFGAVCGGGYLAVMVHKGVSAGLVLGLCLSALLAVVAGMVKEG